MPGEVWWWWVGVFREGEVGGPFILIKPLPTEGQATFAERVLRLFYPPPRYHVSGGQYRVYAPPETGWPKGAKRETEPWHDGG